MNGFTNDHSPAGQQLQAAEQQVNGASINVSARIQEALEIVHGSYSSYESRKEASAFLEHIKTNDEAPYHGFTLASDKVQPPVVRHFALSLLEYGIRYKWPEYSELQARTLREWVIQLSKNTVTDDPLYLRNKTAQLWVEIAKRSWGSHWKDMDELLFELWNLPDVVHKEFVLFVLETLSDEVFTGEDTASVMRGESLQRACVEIFTPEIVLAEAFPNREKGASVRFGEEGWLVRIGEFLNHTLDNKLYQVPQIHKCILRVLAVYKSVMPWAVPGAVASASCVLYMSKSLAFPSVAVQMASVEALDTLYSRMQFPDAEFLSLVCPMFTSQMVGLLRKLFKWSVVDHRDIDDEKYLFAKKLSEMVSVLGSFIEHKFSAFPEQCDLPGLLDLLLDIAQSPSFVISIPVLVTWTRLLRSDTIGGSSVITPLIAPLLELASSRLIRYDMMPQDSDDAAMVFLLEDIDTTPERHAFLGNYRRYSSQIIELIVRQKQSDAIYYILNQVDFSLQHLYDGQAQFNVETYSKNSMPVLRVDASFALVETALKGYMKWRSSNSVKLQQDEKFQQNMENHMETWCERLLRLNFEDPIIRKRVLQLSVAFSTSALDQRVRFMLKVLEHILMSRVPEHPDYVKYTEAVREFQADGMHELQRLAIKMPDHLLDVYDELEETITGIISSGTIDVKRQVALQTFLFSIVHRTTKLDIDTRYQKLLGFIEPIKSLWHNSELENAISSFECFCNLLSLNRAQEYLIARRVHEAREWNTYQLDVEGQEIQKELEKRLKSLPLRTTKSYLQCTTDRLELGTPELKVAWRLWRTALPVILPSLLKFLAYAHAFHNPANWTGLPSDMHALVGRVLSDRFWQAGISEGSKEEFYARVSGTKNTMEGLASSIRGSVRSIREAGYAILFCMSRLDLEFYGFSELPGPLAHALFADAHCLSSHQLINLIQVVRMMIDDCPLELRSHFVPPILASCFGQIDAKCTAEWKSLSLKQSVATLGENLTDEMKEESILRQVTYAAVMMIGALLDPQRKNKGDEGHKVKDDSNLTSTDTAEAPAQPSMREFCLTSPIVLEPILIFLSHAVRMHDTRCCSIVLRIFRSIIPEFSKSNSKSTGEAEFASSIREFISREVLMACISSLNEPYFVDLQKDLAHCISSILTWYNADLTTPRQVLLSIAGIQVPAVNKCLDYISRPGMQTRQQRALVLDLLREIKGVSISEQGRITKSASAARKERTKMQQEFMKEQGDNRKVTGSPVLDGVAGMFAEV